MTFTLNPALPEEKNVGLRKLLERRLGSLSARDHQEMTYVRDIWALPKYFGTHIHILYIYIGVCVHTNNDFFLAVPAGAEVTAPLLSIGALITANTPQTFNKHGKFVCVCIHFFFLIDRDV